MSPQLAAALPAEAAHPLLSVQERPRALASAPRLQSIYSSLGRLAYMPPQCLLLEGGSATERLHVALYWGALLNCAQKGAKPEIGRPCLECPDCLLFFNTAEHWRALRSCPHVQTKGCIKLPCESCSLCGHFFSRAPRNLHICSALTNNFSIDDMRGLRALMGDQPEVQGQRIFLLYEAQSMQTPAANALLKSMEEPRPGTVFILTAPQRESLLPTLVSRSWAMTLPWPDPYAPDQGEDVAGAAEIRSWAEALLLFLEQGTGWMERTLRKGSLNPDLLTGLILFCQKCLALADRRENAPDPVLGKLVEALRKLRPSGRRIFYSSLSECQDSLGYGVDASLLADWLATRLYFVFARERRGSVMSL